MKCINSVMILIGMLMIGGCSERHMNEAESKAIIACVEKGWVPQYNNSRNAGTVKYLCTPKLKDTPTKLRHMD